MACFCGISIGFLIFFLGSKQVMCVPVEVLELNDDAPASAVELVVVVVVIRAEFGVSTELFLLLELFCCSFVPFKTTSLLSASPTSLLVLSAPKLLSLVVSSLMLF